MSNAQIESSRAAASEAVQRKEITKAVASAGGPMPPIGELEHGRRTARCGTLSSRVNIVTCNGGIVLKTDTAARVKKHREALRAAGLRPVQIWVPDIRRPGFAKECRRQSRKLRNDPNEKRLLKWLEKVSAVDDWKFCLDAPPFRQVFELQLARPQT